MKTRLHLSALLGILLAAGCADAPKYSTTGTGGSAGDTVPGGSGGISGGGGIGAGGGMAINCDTPFLYGVNYAWGRFGGDFGNATNGATAQRATRLANMQDMKANGVDVTRWWIFPNFTGGGVAFDAAGVPTGLAGTTTADIATALNLATQAGVHIQFTFFSFDTFKTLLNMNDPTSVNPHNLAPLISDPTKLAAVVNNVVLSFVNAVNASPDKDRVDSWDVINEPEWAISGSDGVDPAFSPQTTVTTVSYPIMRAFVKAVVDALHGASNRPVTVGAAAMQWAKAWSGLGDYYTFHLYDWINAMYPYDRPLSQYGVTDKPVVLGEFPIQGLTGASYLTLVGTIFRLGYAGAMAWSFSDRNFPWPTNKMNVKAFADMRGCPASN